MDTYWFCFSGLDSPFFQKQHLDFLGELPLSYFRFLVFSKPDSISTWLYAGPITAFYPLRVVSDWVRNGYVAQLEPMGLHSGMFC